MTTGLPRALRIGAGLGSAGGLLCTLFVPALLAVVFGDSATSTFTRAGLMPYVSSCVLFPVNAGLFAWLWNESAGTALSPQRRFIMQLGAVLAALMLLGLSASFFFLLTVEDRRVQFAALVWLISIHSLGAVGQIFLFRAVRRRPVAS